MADEQLVYPQAYLAMDNGDLMQVTDFNMTYTNGAREKDTLRATQAGFVFESPRCTVSFDSIIDETGIERDYWRLVEKRQIKQLRVKIPGDAAKVVTSIAINGVYRDVNLDAPIDDATKVSCVFIGKMVRRF